MPLFGAECSLCSGALFDLFGFSDALTPASSRANDIPYSVRMLRRDLQEHEELLLFDCPVIDDSGATPFPSTWKSPPDFAKATATLDEGSSSGAIDQRDLQLAVCFLGE